MRCEASGDRAGERGVVHRREGLVGLKREVESGGSVLAGRRRLVRRAGGELGIPGFPPLLPSLAPLLASRGRHPAHNLIKSHVPRSPRPAKRLYPTRCARSFADLTTRRLGFRATAPRVRLDAVEETMAPARATRSSRLGNSTWNRSHLTEKRVLRRQAPVGQTPRARRRPSRWARAGAAKGLTPTDLGREPSSARRAGAYTRRTAAALCPSSPRLPWATWRSARRRDIRWSSTTCSTPSARAGSRWSSACGTRKPWRRSR